MVFFFGWGVEVGGDKTDYKSDSLPSRFPFHSNQEVRVRLI